MMNETGHCWKCHADLAGHKLRCPSCGVRQAGPPPLPLSPEEAKKPNWLVDITVFFAAPVLVWLITVSFPGTYAWLPAVIIFPLLSALILQWRWWKRSRKSLLADMLTLLLLGLMVFVGLIGLCIWGCSGMLKWF